MGALESAQQTINTLKESGYELLAVRSLGGKIREYTFFNEDQVQVSVNLVYTKEGGVTHDPMVG